MKADTTLRSVRWNKPGWITCACLAAFWSIKCLAQLAAPESSTELSKERENPLTRRVVLPLRYEGTLNDGPYKATKDTFELDQAIVPFILSDDWALITRTKFPVYAQPPRRFGESWQSGPGNGYTTFFLSPEYGKGFYWGIGPVLSYPSANPEVGVNKWGSGPSVAFFKKDQSPWVYGAIVNNIWSFGGPPGSSGRTDSLLVNPFISYHFGDGWHVESSPDITADWLSKAGQRWSVPIGGGVGKTFRLGKRAVRLSVDSYYNVRRPQAGNDTWLVQVYATLLFP